MMESDSPISILIAEDDPNDQLLTREAIEESQTFADIEFVPDGLALLQFLRREGAYATLAGSPLPGIILLDLNMPRMDGREALRVLKSDPALRRIPVVIMTNSKAEEDILHAYDLGVSSYVLKPGGFDELVDLMEDICRYWFGTVTLPH
jgi:two-component system, response regulator